MIKCDKVGYVRVSTTDQNSDNQTKALLEAGVCRDCIFVDHGVSGTIPARNRPKFAELLKYINNHPGEVRYLYVFELSRLGRTTLETITIIEEIERTGISVWSLSPNEGFTRSDDKAVRQLLLMIMSWVAERERANLIERTKLGLERAKSEGKVLGRPRRDIDWDMVNQMRNNSISWDEIAKKLGMTNMQLYRRRKAAGYC